jgi:hypothetical protein
VGLAERTRGANFTEILQKEYKALDCSAAVTRPENRSGEALLSEKIRFYIDDFVFKELIDGGSENESRLHNLLAEIERLGLDPADVAEELYEMGVINAGQRDRLSQGLPY